MPVKILVTGAAGFIGFHLCRNLIDQGHEVVGLDNLNAYYDVRLKFARLQSLGIASEPAYRRPISGVNGFIFYRLDLTDSVELFDLFQHLRPQIVVHLAAQAGVRHSIDQPQSFISSNIQGTFNILEACRRYPVDHLIYASSSSVYGAHREQQFVESQSTDQPISLYGATKKASEVLVHSYTELYQIPSTGLRFFTVYGPWGRPDMAYFKFANLISQGKPIEVYNAGDMARDFTFIDDIVGGIISLINHEPPSEATGLHRILNIGRSSPVNLLTFIELLEKYLGRKAEKVMLPMQPGDVPVTWADTSLLQDLTGYKPQTDLEDGIRKFVDWYTSYHGI